MIGASPAFHARIEQARMAARSDARVLLVGESGTGKELLAAHIHGASPFAGGPFVKVNCAAIPGELIESELFGHEKGSFTGATSMRRGKFELADGGTLFLDEIGDLHANSQAKLLRVLQEGEFHRVGGEQMIRVTVRVVSATNRDLSAMVAQGKFREDLYYRVSVVPIRVPALRERPQDIRPMAEYFLEDFCVRNGFRSKSFHAEVWEAFEACKWPGNARELRNAVERMAILSHDDVLTAAAIPLELECCSGRTARGRACRKRANRPSASMFCGRWKKRAGTCRARRGRWGWSGPICISAFARLGWRGVSDPGTVIRSLEPELMDSPEVKGPVLDKFHRDLNFIHKCLGTFPTIERFIRKDDQPVRRMIDIGCGGGALLEYLRRRMGVEVIGIDRKPPDHANVPIVAADAVTERLAGGGCCGVFAAGASSDAGAEHRVDSERGPVMQAVHHSGSDPAPDAACAVHAVHLPADRARSGGGWKAIHPARVHAGGVSGDGADGPRRNGRDVHNRRFAFSVAADHRYPVLDSRFVRKKGTC